MSLSSSINIFIDFDIILNSKIDDLIKELDMLIGYGKRIYLWSKNYPTSHMAVWCQDNNLFDYVWAYREKDSMYYSCVDFIIDPDEKVVNRFKARGVGGNVIARIKYEGNVRETQ
tara:strand:- start:399 stop:743 length:345 start_codon:yes stop_codon:yes gene_type:complete